MRVFREVYYGIKRSLRNRGFIFWMLIFPIALSIIYKIAFSSFLFKEIEKINVGFYSDSNLLDLFDDIDIINIVKIVSLDDLESEDIDLIVDEDLEIYSKGKNIETRIVKSIVDQIKQMNELAIPYEDYDFTIDYTRSYDQEANGIMIVFFSLLGMVSTYAAFGTSDSTNMSKGDLSLLGARRDMSSHSRWVFLLGGFLESIVLNIACNIVLVLFLKYLLKLKIFVDISNSLLLILAGNIFGASFGMFIGSLNKKYNDNKETIIRALMLVATTMTGMTGTGIKDSLDQKFPMINKLNPIALVTENLYRLNILNNTKRLLPAIFQLALYSIVLLTISYVLLRRNRYDSI